MKTSDISLLEASVTGFEAQKGLYIEATKHHTIVPTEEIIQHKIEYKKWLNEKGKIKPLLLKNEMIIIEGKTADDI
jgi:hypothetical protein